MLASGLPSRRRGVDSHRSRMRGMAPQLNRLASIAMFLLFAVASASAQEASDLQQQLLDLKQQYEQMTVDLRQRIAALEQQLEKQKEATAAAKSATASAAEDAAQEAVRKVLFGDSRNVGAEFQGQVPSRPTYDLLQEA